MIEIATDIPQKILDLAVRVDFQKILPHRKKQFIEEVEKYINYLPLNYNKEFKKSNLKIDKDLIKYLNRVDYYKINPFMLKMVIDNFEKYMKKLGIPIKRENNKEYING